MTDEDFEGFEALIEEPPAAALPAEVAASRARAAAPLSLFHSGRTADGSEVAEPEEVPVTCMICGEQVLVESYVLEAVRTWNRGERELEQRSAHEPHPHRAEYIGRNQIATCEGACTLAWRDELEKRTIQRLQTTERYWKDLRAGTLDPSGAAWLRAEGIGREVDEFYAAQSRSKESE